MPIPVDIEPSDRAEIALALPEGTQSAALSVETEEGRCAFAALDARGRARQHDRALLGWLLASGRAVTALREALSPCDGLPPVDLLVAPPSGWAVGLQHAPERILAAPVGADSAVTLLQAGDDGRWWFVAGRGAAALTAMHGAQPPTRIAVQFDAARAPAGARQEVPLGGAALLDLGEAAPSEVAAVLSPPGLVETRLEGRWLVLVGRGAGAVDGLLRADGGTPEALHVEVGPALAASDRDVIVAVGRTRRLTLDAQPRSVWVADPSRASVEQRQDRLLLTGLSPGRTHLVLRDDSGLFLVPLAIGR